MVITVNGILFNDDNKYDHIPKAIMSNILGVIIISIQK